MIESRGKLIDDFADRAACRGVDPDIFYPESNHKDGPAKRICMTCEVIEECRAYADDPRTREHYGIWGGMTTEERRQRRRRLARQRSTMGQLGIVWPEETPVEIAPYVPEPEQIAARRAFGGLM